MTMAAFILEKSKIIGLLLFLALGAQMILMRPRWQFYPLYLLIFLYFLLMTLNHFRPLVLTQGSSRWIIRIGLFLLIISMVFLLIFPKEKLPLPTGKYPVGTRIYEVEDKARLELYTRQENDHRRIKYQIWYPAEETQGYEKARWITDGRILTRQLAENMHLPSFMLDHTALIASNSYLEAPVSSALQKYPVVIISHGWRGFRELHTNFAEELASHGFIAVSIDHTYGSQAVTFQDGGVALLNQDALPDESDPRRFSEASRVLVTTYGEDVTTVLNDLEWQNSASGDFSDLLDLNAIGLLGHSTGGGGDVFVSLKDQRIKALMGLDAWVNPLPSEMLEKGVSMPVLFLRSEQWSQGPNNTALGTLMSNSENARLIQMNRTTHIDFTMTYMFSPLTEYIGFTGKLGRKKSPEIQREVMLSFFDHHLRQKNGSSGDFLEAFTEKYHDLKLMD